MTEKLEWKGTGEFLTVSCPLLLLDVEVAFPLEFLLPFPFASFYLSFGSQFRPYPPPLP